VGCSDGGPTYFDACDGTLETSATALFAYAAKAATTLALIETSGL
jgi:hypothetical protein